MHTITIIASHPQALAEARDLIERGMWNSIEPDRVRLVTSPALVRKVTAQVHVNGGRALLIDVVDKLDRGGFL